MNIVLVYSPAGNDAVKGSMTWFMNLYEPLIELGHEVTEIRLDLLSVQWGLKKHSLRFKNRFSEYLLNKIDSLNERSPIDLCFCYLMNENVHVDAILSLKKYGFPLVNFSCNNIHQFSLVDKISVAFDLNLYAEKEAKVFFDSLGVSSFWFPMAANPKYYRRKNLPFTRDVGFVGSEYANRAYYIHALLTEGINTEVYGPRWIKSQKLLSLVFKSLNMMFNPDFNLRSAYAAELHKHYYVNSLVNSYEGSFYRPVTDEHMVDIYNTSRIMLGFLEVFPEHDSSRVPLYHVHLREFEAPMMGALYATNYSEELVEFYEPDKEIILFKNAFEMTDKIKFYLKNENLANDIRIAGWRRANSEHTYHARFESLFKKLSLK